MFWLVHNHNYAIQIENTGNIVYIFLRNYSFKYSQAGQKQDEFNKPFHYSLLALAIITTLPCFNTLVTGLRE